MESVEPVQDVATLRLRELVQRHRVCWEVWSVLLSNAQRLQVGYELVLYGTHADEQEPDRSVPGCPRCAASDPRSSSASGSFSLSISIGWWTSARCSA